MSDDFLAAWRDLFEGARSAWPGIDLALDRFVEHARGRLEGAVTAEAIAALRAADLYLAGACAAGDEKAMATFEATYFPEVGAAAARLGVSRAVEDEARQVVRRILFVAEPERAPAVAGYGGRGDLRGWLRVIAVRELQRIAIRDQRSVELDEEQLIAQAEPELAFMRERYRDDVAAAFRAALAGLSTDERRILRYHVIDGMTIDDLAALYRVHRTTAWRRLEQARSGILQRTRDALGERLGIDAAELDSVIRAVHSRLDVTLEPFLRAG